jgi:hypothetical protein
MLKEKRRKSMEKKIKLYDDDLERLDSIKIQYVSLSEANKMLRAGEFKLWILLHTLSEDNLYASKSHIAAFLRMNRSSFDTNIRNLALKGFVESIPVGQLNKSILKLTRILKIEPGTKIIKLRK